MNGLTAPLHPGNLLLWQDSAWRQRWFRRFWVAGIVMMVLHLGHNLGLGNINPVERSLFLLAMVLTHLLLLVLESQVGLLSYYYPEQLSQLSLLSKLLS